MTHRILKYIVAALAICPLASCTDGFLKEYSQDLSRVQTVSDLNELLVGDCYLPKGLYRYEGYQYYVDNPNYAVLHFLGDELTDNLSSEEENDVMDARETYFPYYTWQQNAYVDVKGKSTLTSDEDNYWTLAYEKINNCNMVLESADGLSPQSDTEKMQLRRVKGEAYFLRAFYYLTLVNLYGKPYAPSTAQTDLAVPVKTSGNVEDKEFSRATVAAVYDQIIADLNEAEKQFDGNTEKLSIYHANMEATYILHSRVALYMQDWQTAADYAKKALDKDDYLQTTIGMGSDVYPISKDNQEVVYSNGSSCFGNLIFSKPKADPEDEDDYRPVWIVSDDVYDLYADNDSRKTTYVTTEDDLFDHHPTYHKIDNSRASYNIYKGVSDVFSIRTAEAYLNMAEAKAQLGEDGEACKWLDKLRDTRISDNTPLHLSGEELVNFIRDERERELCFEGHRWFDLRRYSVDARYPFSKEIVHTYTSLSFSYDTYSYVKEYTKHYRLEKNDAAYVLDIPRLERDFQPSIGSNPRPERPAFETTLYDEQY